MIARISALAVVIFLLAGSAPAAGRAEIRLPVLPVFAFSIKPFSFPAMKPEPVDMTMWVGEVTSTDIEQQLETQRAAMISA